METQFRNLSVVAKMMGAFACVMVATVALGLFSLQRLSDLDDNANEMSGHWVPAMKVLAEFQYNSTRFRSFSSTYLLPTSDTEREGTLKLLQKAEKNADEALAKFNAMADSDADRALSRKLTDAWADYKPMRDEQVSLYKSGGLAAAAAYFMGPMRKTFSTLTKATDEAIKYSADGAAQAGTDSHETYSSSRLWVFAVLSLALLLCCGAWWLLSRFVAHPLTDMTGAMGELAAGRLDAEVPFAQQQDEIGQLAEAMSAFKNQLAAAEREKAEQTQLIVSSIGAGLDHLAKGDLTHRITSELVGAFAKLKDDFNGSISHLQDTMTKIMGTTRQIANNASEVSNAADDLSRRTEQQAASLEETAAALEEITATIQRTASNSREVDTSIGTATAAAREGGRVVETAITAMDSISQSSREITEIIGVIDEIAFQTNLLALNAGVEAARAGDAGKGFAVVATEVRALAGRSSEAAKKIKALINASGEHVAGGVKLVGESGAALKRIVDQVQQISSLVSEMAGAAGQQASGIQEVNTAVSQMDQVTQQNAAMVEESTAASRNLANETRLLQELVSYFHVGTGSAEAAWEVKPQPRLQARASRLRPPANAPRQAAAVALAKTEADPDQAWTEF